jgi:hypothetical protein
MLQSRNPPAPAERHIFRRSRENEAKTSLPREGFNLLDLFER